MIAAERDGEKQIHVEMDQIEFMVKWQEELLTMLRGILDQVMTANLKAIDVPVEDMDSALAPLAVQLRYLRGRLKENNLMLEDWLERIQL